MKPCICVGDCEKQRLKDVRAAGFEYIEATFAALARMPEAEYIDRIETAKELGLTVVAACGFFPSDPKLGTFFGGDLDLGAMREFIAAAFGRVGGLHLRSIALGSGFMRRMPDGYAKEKALDFLERFIADEIAPYLEKYDTCLSIEPLQASETNFLNSCCETAALVRHIANDRVGLLCDYFHMRMAGETACDVPKFGDTVRHVHIASPSNSRSFPYAGDGDNEAYAAFFDTLRQLPRFDGFVSVEGGVAKKDEPFSEAAKRTYALLDSLL